ncbi:tyrosine-type recombinase/integrase [Chloroflexota bacterium]
MRATEKRYSNTSTPSSKATDLDGLIYGYKLCARSEGKSPKTILITITALRSLLRFLRSNRHSINVCEINTDRLREYVLYLQQVKKFAHHPFTKPQDKGLSGQSVNCYLRAIRAFWSWLVNEELVSSNPFSRIKIPKPPKKVIPTFSEPQIQALLSTIRVSNPIGFSRDHIILLTLLDTGMRAGELISITLKDLNLDEGIIKLYGKGSKERTIPVGSRVQRVIWKYLQCYRREPFNPLCNTLFLSKSGEPLTVNGLETIVEKNGRMLKISRG